MKTFQKLDAFYSFRVATKKSTGNGVYHISLLRPDQGRLYDLDLRNMGERIVSAEICTFVEYAFANWCGL